MISTEELSKLSQKLLALQSEHKKKQSKMVKLEDTNPEYIQLKKRNNEIMVEVDKINNILKDCLNE